MEESGMKDKSYILGEFVALGQLVEEKFSQNLNPKEPFHNEENLELLFGNLQHFIPRYYQRIKELRDVAKNKGNESMLDELGQFYVLLTGFALDEFKVNRDLFLSGYYFQISIHS